MQSHAGITAQRTSGCPSDVASLLRILRTGLGGGDLTNCRAIRAAPNSKNRYRDAAGISATSAKPRFVPSWEFGLSAEHRSDLFGLFAGVCFETAPPPCQHSPDLDQ